MSAELPVFSKEEMAVEEAHGFPKAYAWLCSNLETNGPFANGPPPSFIPRALQSQQALKVKELNRMFPVIDQDVRRPYVNLKIYAEFLWVQLDDLENAGFDPALFRVDRFGNVVYRHADSSSPLAWDIDHWFPISRGGRTVPSNLRILQWQVCKKKKNKLDFLIPWWDLQLGISVNQFLSIFASKNSDFRSRAFSFFFLDGGEGLECLQNFNLHGFPQKFLDSKRKLGLAPAAIVSSQISSERMTLKAMDFNRPLAHKPPFSASMESFQKGEDAANIELQRFRSNSLRKRNEARKHQEEISRLVGELNKLKQQNDTEQTTLRELEAKLRTTRILVEKFRHLSEIQAYYRSLLENMIRDAMHEAIFYKKDTAQNEAALQTLLARLEAQRADCDSSGSKLCEIYKEREEVEKRALVCSKQALKISEEYVDCNENSHLLWLKSKVRNPIKKKLREFLKEEQNAFEGGISLSFDGKENSKEKSKVTMSIITEESDHCQSSTVHKIKDVIPQISKLEEFALSDESYKRAKGKKKQFFDYCSSSYNVEEGNGKLLVSKDHDTTFNNKLMEIHDSKLNVIMPPIKQKKVEMKEKQAQNSALDGIKTNNSQRQWSLHPSSHKQREEIEEYRYLVGKENAEKWRQIFLENAKEGSPYSDLHSAPRNFDEKLKNANAEIKINEVDLCAANNGREKNISNKLLIEMRFKEKSKVGTSESAWNVASRGKKGFVAEEKEESKKGLPICESSSSRGCKPLPSSPSMIFGLRKREC
ncbi:uncharacterized protein LOC110023095 [Phalaenopsis equestris]|uniref:uncharacterized protein LOC110023095 n=1 Tax=Phalaenopsis equestris TaxID=78828 RepID=UPI0009E1F628|nr:uncharacterized protein LOC110023095 [Phalaenopsis equestris]